MEKQRLDKFVSNQLNISRSKARSLIRTGRTSIFDRVVKECSEIIDVDSDVVLLDGQKIQYKKYIYIMMNKPSGVLCASTDKSRETVIDLLPEKLRRSGLFPVGRLDKDTTGLLLITDDGEFAHNCISPKKGIPKVYKVLLDGKITSDMPEKFSQGVILHDGTICKSAILTGVGSKEGYITITEGKYHQIKRMFGVFDLGVEKLRRISIGELLLPEDLKEGECREISSEELKKSLKMVF